MHRLTRLLLFLLVLLPGRVLTTRAQLPTRPRNLHVLPKDLSTDSVFALMLGVADGLGVTCGFCHVGGDSQTWDSTDFSSDVKSTKVTARAMFALVDRLNHDLLPAILGPGRIGVPMTCMTCHRGAPRPLVLEDTLATVLERQGVDSVIGSYRRIRERYAGRMTYDLREGPLDEIAQRMLAAHRSGDAVKLLEENARDFPASSDVAFLLGTAYEQAGEAQRAVTQYHKVLSIVPAHRQALARLRVLTDRPSPPPPQSNVRPARRNGFGLAFDSRRSRLVLFGGSDSGYTRLDDTWEWWNDRWTQVAAQGPPARSDFAMTFDSQRGRVVVFGGRTASGLMNDTWEYDGQRWTRADSTGPSPRNLVSMAFDEHRGRTVLFGGSAPDSSTWEWDGRHWRSFPPQRSGPAPRGSHVLVYDGGPQRVVLVGGYIDGGVADSWEWDGATWTRVADGPAVFHHAAAYDSKDNRLLVFGGFDHDQRSGKLWGRTSVGWDVVDIVGPLERAEHRGAYVPGIGFVVFGGIGGQGMSLEERGLAKRNDLWAFDGVRWKELGPSR